MADNFRPAALVRQDLRVWLRHARVFRDSDMCWAAECRSRIASVWKYRNSGFRLY